MYSYLSIELGYCFEITESLGIPRLYVPTNMQLLALFASIQSLKLQQAQLASTRYRFGATLDLKLVEDAPVVPFDRAQGEEQPLADLPIR